MSSKPTWWWWAAGACGSGATGRSSGFITPDSELELSELVARFGDGDASLLWHHAGDAIAYIRAAAESASTNCDLIGADSLYVATSSSGARAIREEHEARERLGFASRYYEKAELPSILGFDGYRAGVRMGGTFGIDGLGWARAQQRDLVARGVRVFEESPVVRMEAEAVSTEHAVVRAAAVVMCMDRFAPALGMAADTSYHARASLAVTEPLPSAMLSAMFPDGPLMVWDTSLVYKYFRPTAEGRLLVGGGLLRNTYAANQHIDARTLGMLERYATDRFPALSGVRFSHAWSGLIGMTPDLLPLAGRSRTTPSHYCALSAAGLAWSVLSARTAAACVLGTTTPLDRFFSPDRSFIPVAALSKIIGKAPAWALSYYYARNYQRAAR